MNIAPKVYHHGIATGNCEIKRKPRNSKAAFAKLTQVDLMLIKHLETMKIPPGSALTAMTTTTRSSGITGASLQS